MMKSRSLKKLLAAVMVVALLVMALPMTILAVQPVKTKTNQGQALGHNKVKDKVEDIEEEEEPSEEEEEMSWRAEFVHARNEWAKSEGVMIPPGHANLMLKYLMAEPEVVPDDGVEEDPETEVGYLFADYAQELADLFVLLKTEGIINADTGRLNVKAFKDEYKMPPSDGEEVPETLAD